VTEADYTRVNVNIFSCLSEEQATKYLEWLLIWHPAAQELLKTLELD